MFCMIMTFYINDLHRVCVGFMGRVFLVFCGVNWDLGFGIWRTMYVVDHWHAMVVPSDGYPNSARGDLEKLLGIYTVHFFLVLFTLEISSCLMVLLSTVPILSSRY